MEGKGPIRGGKASFLELDRPFQRQKGLFMGRMDRFSYGNDPFGDPIDPPDDKIDPFRDAKDPLNGKKDFFRKERIISVNNRSFLKRIDYFQKRKILNI